MRPADYAKAVTRTRRLALPDHLVGAAGVAVNDAVGVRAVTDVEVEPPRDLLAQWQRSLRKTVGLVALHSRERRAVGRPGVEVADVRSRVAAHACRRDVGVPDAVVVAAGFQVAHDVVDGAAIAGQLGLLTELQR